MKKIITLLLFLISLNSFSQTSDSVVASIHYISKIKVHEEIRPRDVEMVLDIAKNGQTAFYDRWYVKRKEVRDSVKKAHGNLADMMSATAKYPHPAYLVINYDNYPQKGERTVTESLFKDVYYTENIEPVNWEITNKDSTIAEYNCQSAIGSFRGRKWIVYYTPEIPMSVGPWKLHGLPGAILYAKEESGKALFEAIEVRTAHKKILTPNLQKAIKCTREEYKQMKIEEAHNLREFQIKRFGFDSKPRKADGTPLIYPHKTAVFLED